MRDVQLGQLNRDRPLGYEWEVKEEITDPPPRDFLRM